jgi:hypothetical protein
MLMKFNITKLMKLLDDVNSTYFIAASRVLLASGDASVVIKRKLSISFSFF